MGWLRTPIYMFSICHWLTGTPSLPTLIALNPTGTPGLPTLITLNPTGTPGLPTLITLNPTGTLGLPTLIALYLNALGFGIFYFACTKVLTGIFVFDILFL